MGNLFSCIGSVVKIGTRQIEDHLNKQSKELEETTKQLSETIVSSVENVLTVSNEIAAGIFSIFGTCTHTPPTSPTPSEYSQKTTRSNSPENQHKPLGSQYNDIETVRKELKKNPSSSTLKQKIEELESTTCRYGERNHNNNIAKHKAKLKHVEKLENRYFTLLESQIKSFFEKQKH